jgi:Flp pilus assembly protein TadG
MASWRGEKGQALVEVALLTTILIGLVMGAVNLYYVLQAYGGVLSAAYAGAAYAASSPSNADNSGGISQAALSEGDNEYCLTKPTVSSTKSTDAWAGTTVTVTVGCQVAGMLPLPAIPTAFPVTAHASQRVTP